MSSEFFIDLDEPDQPDDDLVHFRPLSEAEADAVAAGCLDAVVFYGPDLVAPPTEEDVRFTAIGDQLVTVRVLEALWRCASAVGSASPHRNAARGLQSRIDALLSRKRAWVLSEPAHAALEQRVDAWARQRRLEGTGSLWAAMDTDIAIALAAVRTQP